MHIIAAKAVCFKEALEPAFADYQQQIVANARRLAGGAAGGRLPARQRRHRQSPDAGRRLLEGAHRQGRRGGARQGRHHGQQERDPVRSEPADGGERHPHRHAGGHHARHARSRRWISIAEFIARVLSRPGRRWRRSAMVRDGGRGAVPEVPAVPGVAELTDAAVEAFAADGPLARALAGFEPRAGQVEMAEAVAACPRRAAACCSPKRAPAPARRSPTSSRPSSAASACSSRPAPRTSRNRSSSRTCPSCARRSACRSPPPT